MYFIYVHLQSVYVHVWFMTGITVYELTYIKQHGGRNYLLWGHVALTFSVTVCEIAQIEGKVDFSY